ncbi:hypothetical protein O1611_g10304 [Lasiodiplodia mahajangana]|uniref:Uncharacterized protein n=1 Tax=Lasiodiplodia mahajangana TaxID=1108764 RepID=A0ACC2IZQ2_9PEZI|nr:hypothetical protein O1611_g10304 [Lasiodiplodia mahajangana]
MARHQPLLAASARTPMKTATQSTPRTSVNHAPAAIRAMAASHLVVVTKRAETTSTTSCSTTSSASMLPSRQRKLTHASSPTYRSTISKSLSHLIFSSRIFSPAWTMYQMVTMKQSMPGEWNGRLPMMVRTRKQRQKSSNANFFVSASDLGTGKESGSSHSAITTTSGLEVGNRVIKYGIAEIAGVAVNSKNGTAENATNALMGGGFPAADVEGSLVRTTRNAKNDQIQAIFVKVTSGYRQVKKVAKKLRTRSSKISLRKGEGECLVRDKV